MEKKKFKLNIIDIIIIIAVVAVVVFLGMKVAGDAFVPGQDYTAGSQHTYHITFHTDEVADFVLDNTHIGDSAYDFSDEVELGKVVKIETGACIQNVIDNGQHLMIEREGYSSADITVEVRGKENEHGVEVDGTLYSVGHTLILYAGMGKYYLPISNVEIVD